MVDSVRKDFAGRFRQALLEAGYGESQLKRLGDLFGVSGQAVRKWLHGEAIPSSTHAAGVAQTLGVRRAWLLDGELPMHALRADVTEPVKGYSQKETVEFSISAQEFRLLKNYRKLPGSVQASIDALLESMGKEMIPVRRSK